MVSWAAALNAQTAPDNFRIALTGDSIIDRKISVYKEPAYLQMFERIRHADAAFTNFEMLIHSFEFPGAAQSGGVYMGTDASVLDELKWGGFNLFGTANNHAYDFGEGGLMSTIRAFEHAGLTHAGTGENLARARAPGYLETAKGRVALISTSSTFSVMSPASEQRPDMKGRPGLNPLHIRTTYIVDQPALDTLRKLARSGTGEGGGGGAADQVRLNGSTFRLGNNPGTVLTEPDPKDMQAIAASVKEARREADWVVVSIHAHEAANGDREIPAQFLPVFARAMIDAGADLFVGHGPHVLRAIEIYKGKPIFYSMGNFIFQNETLLFQPQENYDSVGLSLSATPPDFYDARSKNDTISFPADPEYWESMVAEAVFNSRRELQQIDIFPITLGYKQPRTVRGRPTPASAQDAQKIVDRLARLSRAAGTTVEFSNGKGMVRIGAKAGNTGQ
jgi:poly-gamma-glutamate synthesis protein (capsule biosynthesis protein)